MSKKFKSIKVSEEIYDLLQECELDGSCRGSFSNKIAEAMNSKSRSLSPETVEELKRVYGEDTALTNTDAFIQSIIVNYKASQLSNIGAWTKSSAPDLMKSGFSEDEVLKTSEFEAFYDSDSKAAAMSLFVAVARLTKKDSR